MLNLEDTSTTVFATISGPAPPEGLQNGRLEYADPLQLRQRVARDFRFGSGPLTFRHCGGMTEARSQLLPGLGGIANERTKALG